MDDPALAEPHWCSAVRAIGDNSALASAFPRISAPTLMRDNDRFYGRVIIARVQAMGIRNQPITPRSP
jgi:hypothetical protein